MCAADAFNEVEGSVTCDKCGQYMLYNQTTKNCFCLPTFILQPDDNCSYKTGETLMGTTCQPCETAKWKAEIGVTNCNLCSFTLQFSTTKSLGSTSNSSCICPAGKYDDLNGKCEDVTEGMNHTVAGMTLETLEIEPEFWRTNSRSTDIRECPVPEACVGGNGTNYCRVGHDGPYCNLCVDGWTMDPLMLCKSCKNSSTDTAITLVVLAVGAALFLVFTS